MIIEKIVIGSFGLITDLTLEFSERVNVIEGQNESGKSTIAAFIKYMLYGFDDRDVGEASERKKRINWNTGVAQGSMYVRVGDKRYLISRSTTPVSGTARETYKEEAAIIDLETGTPAFGKLSAGDVFFGVDRELFDNTAFIGQVGDTGINEITVRECIENILFSGSERLNCERAIAKINGKMTALLHEGGSGGAIVDLIKREESLEEKLAACEEDNRLVLERESELHKIRERRSVAEDKQAKLHELNSCYSNVMLIQTFDQLHGLEEQLEEKTEAYNAFIADNSKDGFVPDEEYLAELSLARKEVNESYRNLGDAEDSYTDKKRAIGITHEIENAIEKSDAHGGEAELSRHASAYHRRSVLSLMALILSGLLAVALAVFEILAIRESQGGLFIAIYAVGALSAIAGGVIFALELMKSSRALSALEKEFGTENYRDLIGKISVIAEARCRRDSIKCEQESAKSGVADAREQYEAAKLRLTALVRKWSEDSPTSELGGYLDGLEERIRDFLKRKHELYEEKTGLEITVREIRRTLSDKSEIDVRAQVSPLKRKALSGVNYDEIITGISEIKEKIDEEDRLAFEVENELMLLKGRAGDPGDYYSRIQSVSERRRELQEKHKAYYLALDALKGAGENLRREISPRLAEYATNMMSTMTDRKYTAFDVSEGLKVSFIDGAGESRSVDFLSGGTRDMAYIAMRCALIDMLYTEKPPITFDESFAHQDNNRARAMMKAIKQLSDEGVQSFIFTCRNREATLASELVSGAGIYKLSGTQYI